MSLRDIYGNNDDKPIILNTEPAGNAGGLGSFHTINPEDREPNNTPKIVGGLVVALMLGAAGAYIYSVSGHQPKQVVANNSLPAPSAPAPAAAPAPMPTSDTTNTDNSAAMPTPAATKPAPEAMPAPTPANDTSTKPVSHPVRQASISRTHRAASETSSANAPDLGAAQARMQADNTPAVQPQPQTVQAPQQQAAVEPVSPQAPSSAMANNTVQPTVAPQQAQSSTPQADNSAPAQDQQTGATPAPAAQPASPPAQ